jgi:Spy/CpxP family protein refolding chaperone
MARRRGWGLLAGVLVVTLGAAVVEAQGPGAAGRAGAAPRAYNPSRRVPAFFGQVGLTPSQREQIYSIRGKYYDQIADLKQQIEDLEAKEDTDCAGVLTDSQRKLLDSLRTARRGGTARNAPAAEAPAAAAPAARTGGNG